MSKAKLIRDAAGALGDIVDEGRRAFLKKAPVVAAGGALGGLGAAAVVGAKALFGQGKLDDIIAKIKSSFDEDWQNISLNTAESLSEILQKNLNYNDDEFFKISDETGFIEQFDMIDLDPDKMSSAEISKAVKGLVDDAMSDYSYDFAKGRGTDPKILIDEFKIPAFKNEVIKKFPDIDLSELDDLSGKLF